MSDIAIDSSGQVYGVDVQGFFFLTSRLYKVNLPGASTTLVSALGVFVNSLEFRDDGLLFAAGGNRIYQVNTTTGAATAVISLPARYESAGDIEFDANGNMYVTMDNGSLIRVASDLSTWQDLGSAGAGDFFGLIFAEDRRLYGLRNAEQIYRIDLQNGSATFVANIADPTAVGVFGAATDSRPGGNGLPPAAPTDLFARGSSSNVLLQWMDHSTNEEAFQIERKTGVSGAYALTSQVGSNVDIYQDGGLSTGVTYCYRVYASNAVGNSAYSNEACGTALATPVLSLPADGATITANFVTLQWNPVAAAEAYGVDLGTVCGDHSVLGSEATTPSTSVHVPSLENGTYYWRVTAASFTYLGLSAPSACRSFVVAAAPSCGALQCATLSGEVRVEGGVLIRGGQGRTVTLVDRQRGFASINPIAPDGSYRAVVPVGSYAATCDIEYVDVASGRPRRASESRPVDLRADRTEDFVFPPPLVLLHGINSGPAKWADWIDRLAIERPEMIVITPVYGYCDASSDVVAGYSRKADELHGFLLQAFGDLFAGVPPYRVIAHSMGGLVARAFRNVYSGDPLGVSMSDVILLGTPNNGSECADEGDLLCRLRPIGLDYSNTSRHALAIFNDRWPSFPDLFPCPGGDRARVHAIVGTSDLGFLCPGLRRGASSDGLVAVESALTINDGRVSRRLPGLPIPYTHLELGSRSTAWLLAEVILPYYDQPSASTSAGLFPQCPSWHPGGGGECEGGVVAYSGCLGGNGYIPVETGGGVCGVIPAEPGAQAVRLDWLAPSGRLLAPPSMIATAAAPAAATACTSLIDRRLKAFVPWGYNVYRSNRPITSLDRARRIGAVGTETTEFTDNHPLPGENHYVVTAVWSGVSSGIESEPSNQATVSIPTTSLP